MKNIENAEAARVRGTRMDGYGCFAFAEKIIIMQSTNQLIYHCQWFALPLGSNLHFVKTLQIVFVVNCMQLLFMATSENCVIKLLGQQVTEFCGRCRRLGGL